MKTPVKRGQQSVLLAVDTETGRLIEAGELLDMEEPALRRLRRASLDGLTRSGKTESEPRLQCALCDGPVHISMRRTEFGNRWFAHHGEITACPYRSNRRMSADQQFAWQYQGQQEGSEHRWVKHFIADWVEREPGRDGPVWRDRVRPSELKPGEWKRPDVRAVVNGRELVFEIQLSYTFLSEVIRRDTFYRQEGVHILWIFRAFQPHREVVRDEAFYNRRNVFVLDEDAEAQTVRRGRFTLKCYYQTPIMTGGTLSEKWHWRYVHLDRLNFPQPAYRPYFRDFDEARFRLLRLRLIRSIMHWSRLFKRKDEKETARAFEEAREAWRTLEDHAAVVQPESLSEDIFLSEHLPRLLSIKYGRPIGYRYKTVWEVLNVALSMSSPSPRPYNILYLMAVKEYRPGLADHHTKRIEEHRHEIAASIKAGESRFLRDQRYDDAIALVLPELLPRLDNRYGLPDECDSDS